MNLELEAGSRLAPLPAKINPEDVVTILGNMIDNAFDSVRSAISLQADFEPLRRQIDVSLTDYGNEIILEVSDQGVGLPQELSPEALVEMGVSSKADEGRGVGLYLINQSIVRYNGQIELFNNDDFGARVTVYLPKEEMQ